MSGRGIANVCCDGQIRFRPPGVEAKASRDAAPRQGRKVRYIDNACERQNPLSTSLIGFVHAAKRSKCALLVVPPPRTPQALLFRIATALYLQVGPTVIESSL